MERPLLEATMQYAKGNQSKAALILGLNRGTFRKKLAFYGKVEVAPDGSVLEAKHIIVATGARPRGSDSRVSHPDPARLGHPPPARGS